MKTINGRGGVTTVPAKPGQQVRLRVINTDNGPIETWGRIRLSLLLTGHPVNGRSEVTDRSVTVTAGGRADFGVTMPNDGRL